MPRKGALVCMIESCGTHIVDRSGYVGLYPGQTAILAEGADKHGHGFKLLLLHPETGLTETWCNFNVFWKVIKEPDDDA